MAARLLRRGLRRAATQRRFPNVHMEEMPVLFANSFPKSGTHLLTQVLAGFERLGPVAISGLPAVLTFEGESGRERPVQRILADLDRFLSGDIGYGHLHAKKEIADTLCGEGFAPFFVYRDPRDVVVSHVFYVTDINNRHVHHDYYVNQLATFEERLRVSILGRPELDVPFPDIRSRFEPYLGWLDRPEVLAVRFEDMVSGLEAAAGRIFDHAVERGFVSAVGKEQAVSVLVGSVNPKRSPTFRSGKVGGWREHFNAEHKALFKEVSGELLRVLGYEKGNDW